MTDDEGQDYISDQEQYEFEQSCLPPHKRDGWLESRLERMDDEQKRRLEEWK